MKVYTDAEYDRLYEETLSYEQIETNIRGFYEVGAVKSQWNEKQYCYADLSSGIRLEVINRQILLDYNQLTEHYDYPVLTAKFYLNGYHNVICPGLDGIAPEYAETGGQNYLFYLPDIEEIEQRFAGDRLQLLRIEIDLNTIGKFVDELNSVPRQLQTLIENENPQRFYLNVGGITSQMQTVVQHILQHPYQGAIAKMYLEAKVLELLALQFTQLTELKSDAANSTLRPKSIDRIYQARDILEQRMEEPPSLLELARMVGLNDYKLKQGFRRVFGTTVFGYLREYRLEQARQLLTTDTMSVGEVAYAVGYSNRSYFTSAFIRKYGIKPKEYLLKQRRYRQFF